MKNWHKNFDDREQALIRDCQRYSTGDAAGLPGHKLILIVAKFNDMMDTMEELTIDLGNEPKFKKAMAAFQDPQPLGEPVVESKFAVEQQAAVLRQSRKSYWGRVPR